MPGPECRQRLSATPLCPTGQGGRVSMERGASYLDHALTASLHIEVSLLAGPQQLCTAAAPHLGRTERGTVFWSGNQRQNIFKPSPSRIKPAPTGTHCHSMRVAAKYHTAALDKHVHARYMCYACLAKFLCLQFNALHVLPTTVMRLSTRLQLFRLGESALKQ